MTKLTLLLVLVMLSMTFAPGAQVVAAASPRHDISSHGLLSYAVIDRIVDDTFAVILVGPGSQETIIRLSLLNIGSSDELLGEGIWGTFKTGVRSGRLLWAKFSPDRSKTLVIHNRIATKVAELRSR